MKIRFYSLLAAATLSIATFAPIIEVSPVMAGIKQKNKFKKFKQEIAREIKKINNIMKLINIVQVVQIVQIVQKIVRAQP